MKIQPSRRRQKLADHSYVPTARPLEAPEPARPITCSLPMFVENRVAPTANQPMCLPARKYSVVVFLFREW